MDESKLPPDILDQIRKAQAADYASRPPLAQSGLIDESLPRQQVDPNKEWIYPGHADPTHRFIHGRTGELIDNGPHVLLRVFTAVKIDGADKPIYAMVHGHGHQTDVYHTYPKSHWKEADAAEFHRQMQAHPSWSEPDNRPKKKVSLPDLMAQARAKAAATGNTKGDLL